MRIGINGFGRIGRCILRAIFERKMSQVSFLQINSSTDIKRLVHLIKHDSVHGTFAFEVKILDQNLINIEGINIELSSERDLSTHKWKDIDVVMECTGKLKTLDALSSHIKIGGKKVILSTMADDERVPTIILGANQDTLEKQHKIISIGSCTTNCLAPVAKIINDSFGIEKGFITTVHAYTNDQNLIDSNHSDLRRARCAGVSIIPTSTGAAKAIGKVIKDLDKKLDGASVRVPVPNVSMIDCSFLIKKDTSPEKTEQIIIESCSTSFYKKAITFCKEPLVSIDFNHNPYSSIVDIPEIRVVDRNLLRIVSWYDNEWGFSNRMIDTALTMNNL